MSKGMTHSMEPEEPFYVRRRPDPIPFRKFLYNKEKGTVMGRTGVSWGKHCIYAINSFINNLCEQFSKAIEQVAHF